LFPSPLGMFMLLPYSENLLVFFTVMKYTHPSLIFS
jgi:hypothetical protein